MEPGRTPAPDYVTCPVCKRPTWVEKDKLAQHLKEKHGVEEAPKASGFLAGLFE